MGKTPKSAGKKDKREPISGGRSLPYITETPLWSFKKLDRTYHKWQMTDEPDVLDALKAYEGLTRATIMSDKGNKSKGHGSKSHFVEVSNLAKEAQQRLSAINLDSEDVLFSLRTGGKKRIYGILNNRWLEIIWYDKNHEIYPIDN